MEVALSYYRRCWLFFCVVALQFSVMQASLVSRQAAIDSTDLTIQTFNVSTICHIEGAGSVLVNNTLWINGGVITQQECGNCTPWLDINTYVFAIPFTELLSGVDWSTLSYQAYRKPKAAPISCRSPLWRNQLGTELYTFAGNFTRNDSSVNYKDHDSNIWRFSTLNQTWSIVSLALLDWIDLQHTSIPSMDKSFAFGPISEFESRLVVMDSSQSPPASARLDTADVPTGSLHRGQLIHIPVPGGDGVLVEFGGAKDTAVGAFRDVGLDTVNVYDMDGKKWYTQRTSSEIAGQPVSRHNFCSVLASENSTSYEIVMYGGDFNDVQDSHYIDGFWMLSIPTFRWWYFEDPDIRVRLSGTTCQLIGPHLIRFGGWRQNNGPYPPPWDPVCMNPVSIFNLNSMLWTDRFDPSAAPYRQPPKIAAWNAAAASPAKGWDEGVQALFAGLNVTSDYSAGNGTAAPGNEHPADPKKKSSAGAIAGGVVAGVAVLALAAAAAVYLRRRKNKSDEKAQSGYMTEDNDYWQRHEMPAFQEERPPAELNGS